MDTTKLNKFLKENKNNPDILRDLEHALIFGQIDTNNHLTTDELLALIPVKAEDQGVLVE